MIFIITKGYGQIFKYIFLFKETVFYYFLNKSKLKILFSIAPLQNENLKKGLYFTNILPSFEKFTKDNIAKNDLIVPLTISDLRILNESRELIVNNRIPIPSWESINICDDKFLFYQTLEKNFSDYLPKISKDLQIPYILKKKRTEQGVDNYIISDESKVSKYQNLISSDEYFCQEIISGKTEYATHILFKENKITGSLNIEYYFNTTMPIKGQDDVVAKRIVNSKHLKVFAEILELIKFEGICCFNYKEINGHPYIIEINPRFGASLSLYFISFLRKI